MESKTIIIVGSSRNHGNTIRISELISRKMNFDIINLNDYRFSYYDYENNNREDDFLPLAKKIIDNYNTIIFSTPVYWYSMSGVMKVFFDRFSDLIRIEKETGRKLRGKNMFVISNTHDDELDYDFYLPFRLSAKYLGMHYLGNHHYNCDKENLEIKEIKI